MSTRTTLWGYIELRENQVEFYNAIRDKNRDSNKFYSILSDPISTQGYLLVSFAYTSRGGYSERDFWINLFEGLLKELRPFHSAKICMEYDDRVGVTFIDYVFDYEKNDWLIFESTSE